MIDNTFSSKKVLIIWWVFVLLLQGTQLLRAMTDNTFGDTKFIPSFLCAAFFYSLIALHEVWSSKKGYWFNLLSVSTHLNLTDLFILNI